MTGTPHGRMRAPVIIVGIVAAWAAMLLGVAPAVAQQFEKVDEAARENLPATPFVAAAYGFIWLAVLTYVVVTARRVRRVEGEIANLRRRVESGGGGTAPR
jgi:CcmD family protein